MQEESRHFRSQYPAGVLTLLADALRATAELALSNRRLRGLAVRDLMQGTVLPDTPQTRVGARQNRLLAERLAYVIPRVGRRLPWRADCLVQALAARRWLARQGIASSLHIGTRKDGAAQFEAHAWLTVGQLVVTGWDIAGLSGFAEFPVRSTAP